MPDFSAAQSRPLRAPRRAVHGVLLLDKPLGLSSNQALQVAKRLFRAEKAGHAGTLDPLASGLLPLCFGAATKFSQAGLDADKGYTATLKLGVTTTTGDLEGEVLKQTAVSVTRAQLLAACAQLTGETLQMPPMHCALKHQGKALYEYARAGVAVQREPRRISVSAIDVIDGAHDVWRIDVRCGKGTYIRVLAEDIGKLLGCGAHLQALRRIGCGLQSIDSAITLDALAALDEAGRDACLLTCDALLGEAPLMRLDATAALRFLAGVRQRLDRPDAPLVRVYGPQTQAFLGSAQIRAHELIGNRLLSTTEAQGLLAQTNESVSP
ncbi:MAG: tRNA pseudouridine(55) synthase TruB [Burkholderiales bacterium]|nr:tRNA pseudouridine(55) synthase TruB [Burkholderiales bacterium]